MTFVALRMNDGFVLRDAFFHNAPFDSLRAQGAALRSSVFRLQSFLETAT